jgi:catechol 2,3-dioxygenase-like lactoylglutathione lyase family enzyme
VPTGTARVQSGPSAADVARSQSGSAWVQPTAARPAPDDEDRWVPGAGPAASTVPPDVETRPLGSRTRFFAQPGEETESFATEDAEQAHAQPAAYPAQSRPEPTPSSSASTPSPVAPPPIAPAPDRPFPSAPPPATPRTAAPRPGIDQIDIPLDNFPLRGHTLPIDSNPAPAPEDEPQAATARADGIMASPAEENPRPSALRDGILGVAVGRAAVSPDAFPTPHLDDVPAPGTGQEKPGATPEQPSTAQERPSTSQGQPDASRVQPGTGQEKAATGQAQPNAGQTQPNAGQGQPGAGLGQAAASQGQPGPAQERSAEGGEPRRNGPWGDFNGRPDEHAGDVITGYPSARPSTAASIHGVGITVLVTDLERSTEFYRDVLGFHEIDNGDGSAVLASGDTRLVLRTVHNLTAEAGRLIYLNLEVGDIEAVHAELREKGVKFVHSPRPVNRGDKLELWSATFRDPDNHNIAITQWRAIH